MTQSGKLHIVIHETFDGWKTRCNRRLNTISDSNITDKKYDKNKCVFCLNKIKKLYKRR